MKKFLVILMVLGIAGYALAQDTGSQVVTMNVAQAIELTVPSNLSWGDLAPGSNESPAQVVNVKSNALYDLSIKNFNGASLPDSVALKPWKYDTEADTFFIAGGYIDNTTQFKGGDVASYTNITTENQAILTEASATDDTGTDTNVYYSLSVGWGDERLTGANQAYAIKMTFYAVHSVL